jgi:hypothetical protein
MSHRKETFADFWQHYLREHARPGTRWLHFLGTAIAGLMLIAGLITLSPGVALLGVAAGYVLAWTGHFLIEGNRPTMLARPFWSLCSDIRMFALWLSGGLDIELTKAGVAERERDSTALP